MSIRIQHGSCILSANTLDEISCPHPDLDELSKFLFSVANAIESSLTLLLYYEPKNLQTEIVREESIPLNNLAPWQLEVSDPEILKNIFSISSPAQLPWLHSVFSKLTVCLDNLYVDFPQIEISVYPISSLDALFHLNSIEFFPHLSYFDKRIQEVFLSSPLDVIQYYKENTCSMQTPTLILPKLPIRCVYEIEQKYDDSQEYIGGLKYQVLDISNGNCTISKSDILYNLNFNTDSLRYSNHNTPFSVIPPISNGPTLSNNSTTTPSATPIKLSGTSSSSTSFNYPPFKSTPHHSLLNGKQYFTPKESLCFAGTFDHLHVGHMFLLISISVLKRKNIYLGLTMDLEKLLFQKLHRIALEPFILRAYKIAHYMHLVCHYLGGQLPNIQAISSNIFTDATFTPSCKFTPALPLNSLELVKSIYIFDLTSPIGPAVVTNAFESLVVTTETLKGGLTINNKRLTKRNFPLNLLLFNCIPFESKLSSRDIRQRWVDSPYFGNFSEKFSELIGSPYYGLPSYLWWMFFDLYHRKFKGFDTSENKILSPLDFQEMLSGYQYETKTQLLTPSKKIFSPQQAHSVDHLAQLNLPNKSKSTNYYSSKSIESNEDGNRFLQDNHTPRCGFLTENLEIFSSLQDNTNENYKTFNLNSKDLTYVDLSCTERNFISFLLRPPPIYCVKILQFFKSNITYPDSIMIALMFLSFPQLIKYIRGHMYTPNLQKNLNYSSLNDPHTFLGSIYRALDLINTFYLHRNKEVSSSMPQDFEWFQDICLSVLSFKSLDNIEPIAAKFSLAIPSLSKKAKIFTKLPKSFEDRAKTNLSKLAKELT